MTVSETRALLERTGELAQLSSALEEARGGQGALVVIEGPAGIGKSTLLGDARTSAAGAGFTVLDAIGSPLERELAFGIVLQLFDATLADATEKTRASLLDGAAGLAAPLFAHGALERAPGTERQEDPGLPILHGLHWLAANMALQAPLLLLVDDAHQCDGASLRFLHYLAQRSSDLPVAIALASRSGETMEADAVAALDELRAHPRAHLLAPRALSEEAVTEIVRESFPDADEAFCTACGRASAGNPFYLRSLLLALESDGVTPTVDAASRVSKLGARAVSRSVLTRFARLPSGARTLADACAVLGEGCRLSEATALSDLDQEAAVEAADALAAAETLTSGEPLAFVHPVVREALYEELPPSRRAGLHLRAAELVRGRSPDAAATHLLVSQHGGGEWVVDLLREAAARATERGAPELAARYLNRALEEPDVGARRGDLLFDLGLAETAAGNPAGGDHIIEAAEELGDPVSRSMALMSMGRILALRARFGESARVFARAAEELASTDPPLEGAEQLARWARGGFALAGTRDVASCTQARIELAAISEDAEIEADAFGRSVLGFAAIERIHAARPATEALELVSRILGTTPGDDPTDTIAFGISSIAFALCGEVESAERVSSELDAVTSRRGSVLDEPAIAYHRMIVAYQAGDLPEAMRYALASIDGLQLGFGAGIATAYAVLTRGHLDRGELTEAREVIEEGLRGGAGADEFLAPFALEARGAVRLAAGEAEAALEDFLEAGSQLELRGIRNPAMSAQNWRSGAALAAARVGRPERARELAGEELGLAEAFAVPGPIGGALRTRGLIENGAESIELLRRSTDVLRDSPSGLDLARSLLEYGAALRRAKQRRDCREPLHEAVELARAAGATGLVEQAHKELRASGARPRSLVLSGVESLTPSERRVADLAVTGRSNREIAQELYLTVKTVETHLGHVYAKLEIEGRPGLAGALSAPAEAAE